MTAARRRAEEALAEWDTLCSRPDAVEYDQLVKAVVGMTKALRSLLADAPPSPAPDEVIHASPEIGAAVMPCCGRSPFEVPMTDRVTLDPQRVTCGKPAADEVREALAAARELLAAVRTGHLASIGAERNVYVPQIGVAWLTPLADKIELGAALAAVTQRGAADEVREAAERLRRALCAVPSWEALLPKQCGLCEGIAECSGDHEPCGCHETLLVIEGALDLLSALAARGGA